MRELALAVLAWPHKALWRVCEFVGNALLSVVPARPAPPPKGDDLRVGTKTYRWFDPERGDDLPAIMDEHLDALVLGDLAKPRSARKPAAKPRKRTAVKRSSKKLP